MIDLELGINFNGRGCLEIASDFPNPKFNFLSILFPSKIGKLLDCGVTILDAISLYNTMCNVGFVQKLRQDPKSSKFVDFPEFPLNSKS